MSCVPDMISRLFCFYVRGRPHGLLKGITRFRSHFATRSEPFFYSRIEYVYPQISSRTFVSIYAETGGLMIEFSASLRSA